jgi:hypothetical protein
VRLHKVIEGRLSSHPQCEVIPAGDLLAAKHGASPSEILAAYSGWGAVHGSGGAYTRMALTLVDKVMGGTFKQQQPPPAAPDGGSKRKRAESGSFSGGGNPFLPSRRLNSMDNQPGFSRVGFRGGARGGKSGQRLSRRVQEQRQLRPLRRQALLQVRATALQAALQVAVPAAAAAATVATTKLLVCTTILHSSIYCFFFVLYLCKKNSHKTVLAHDCW